MEILISKPVLIGIHVGFAIIGIDAFLWLLGEIKTNSGGRLRILTAAIGTASFMLSWLAGGYYYVTYYGNLVRPIIKGGLSPWAHGIAMETKEHIFLLIIPLAFTALLITTLKTEEWQKLNIKKAAMFLVATIALFGLAIGVLGFMVSAAARWG